MENMAKAKIEKAERQKVRLEAKAKKLEE